MPSRSSRFRELDLDDLHPQTSLPTPPPTYRNTPLNQMSPYRDSTNPYTGTKDTSWPDIPLQNLATTKSLPLSYRNAPAPAPAPPMARSSTTPTDPTKDLSFYKPPKTYKRHALFCGLLAILLLLILIITIPILAISAHNTHHLSTIVTSTTTMTQTATQDITATRTSRLTTTPAITTAPISSSEPEYEVCAQVINDHCAGM